MFIMGLNGSPNKRGNTAFLLDTALKAAEVEGAKTETFFVQEVLNKLKRPFCTACETPCQDYAGTELETALEKWPRRWPVSYQPIYFGQYRPTQSLFGINTPPEKKPET